MNFRHEPSFLRGRVFAVLALALGFTTALAAEHMGQALTELSLEDLMQIEVTSASRKPQPLGEAASAVYILTAREIARSSATTIPELLRRVPGLHVARLESSGWAVTARGFNHRYASKMLVQIDGRTVYAPLFGGVYWDAHNLLLSDVERIEVIRGPGATMWGENAVNGVINIITKPAAATTGTRVETVGGNEEASVAIRHGGSGGGVDYRVYAKGYRQDAVALADGTSAADAYTGGSAGFRLDVERPSSRSLTLDGQVYRNDGRQVVDRASFAPPHVVTFEADRRVRGGYVGGRWRPFAGADATLFGFVDRSRREGPDGFVETRHTYELDYEQRHVSASGRHDLVWGGQLRYTTDAFENTFRVSLDPSSRGLHLASGFVQDEVALARERVLLTFGTKVTHNGFTGFEVQPSLRALVKLDGSQALWGAVSRAVRTPSRVERDMRVNAAVLPSESSLPTLVSLFGSPIAPERLLAFEGGYRIQGRRAGLDVALFANRHEGLTTTALGTPEVELEPTPHVLVPIHFENGEVARTAGLEVLGRWTPHTDVELQAWYSWFGLRDGENRKGGGGEVALVPDGGLAAVPEHQARLDAHLHLHPRLAVDTSLHYVGALDTQSIDAYLRFDARVAFQLHPALELSLAGQNLLDGRHPEFAGEQGRPPFHVERAVLARLAWTF